MIDHLIRTVSLSSGCLVPEPGFLGYIRPNKLIRPLSWTFLTEMFSRAADIFLVFFWLNKTKHLHSCCQRKRVPLCSCCVSVVNSSNTRQTLVKHSLNVDLINVALTSVRRFSSSVAPPSRPAQMFELSVDVSQPVIPARWHPVPLSCLIKERLPWQPPRWCRVTGTNWRLREKEEK